MTPFLPVVLGGEALLVLVLLGFLARLMVQRRRDALRSVEAAAAQRLLLNDLIAGTHDGDAALTALPLRWRTKVLAQLATKVGSSERAALRVLAERCGVAAQTHRYLGARRAVARVAGLRAMTPLEIRDPTGLALLTDRRAAVRAAALWWVAVAYRDADAPLYLAQHADDPDAHVRLVVTEGLIANGADAVPAVVGLITAGSPMARRTALLAAVGLRDPAIADATIALLTDPDPALRIAAARAVAGASTPRIRDQLAVLLADPDPAVRAVVAQLLGEGHIASDAVRLGPLLHDSDDNVRIAAGRALLALGPIGELAVRATVRSA